MGKPSATFIPELLSTWGFPILQENASKTFKQSPLPDPLLQWSCPINFDDFSILARDCNKLKSLIRENLLVKRDKPILNKKVSFMKMTVLFPISSNCQNMPKYSNPLQCKFNVDSTLKVISILIFKSHLLWVNCKLFSQNSLFLHQWICQRTNRLYQRKLPQ